MDLIAAHDAREIVKAGKISLASRSDDVHKRPPVTHFARVYGAVLESSGRGRLWLCYDGQASFLDPVKWTGARKGVGHAC